MIRRVLVILILALILPGCRPSEPAVAGGKPVDHWLELVTDSDPKKRVEAIQKLGNIGGKDSSAVDAIIDALDDPDPKVRKEAIFAVVRIGRIAQAAFPKLEQMADEDANDEIRKMARESYDNLVK